MAGGNKKIPDSKSKVFTLEPSNGGTVREMPSITSLLNRKKLSIPKGQSENEVKDRRQRVELPTKKAKSATQITQPAVEPTATETPIPSPEISLAFEGSHAKIELESSPQPIETKPLLSMSPPPAGPVHNKPAPTEVRTLIAVPDLEPSVETILGSRPAKEKTIVRAPPSKPAATNGKVKSIHSKRAPAKKIAYWEAITLQNSSDLIGKAMAQLLDQGASSVLFMEIVPPHEGTSLPVFQATSLSGSQKYEALWNGMCWDPAPTPSLWRTLLKKGIYELDPKSNFAALRLAFGVSADEWVSVVRAGPSFNCRGVIAVVSKDSVKGELTQIKKLISTLIKKQESSAA